MLNVESDTYHYALLIGSKSGTSELSKHHVKNTIQNVSGSVSQPWRYEATDVTSLTNEPGLLVLVTIGKVLVPCDQLKQILLTVPIYQVEDGDIGNGFDCVEWVRLALERLWKERAVSGCQDWADVKASSLDYVHNKKAEGRFQAGWTGDDGIPVLDLTDMTERTLP